MCLSTRVKRVTLADAKRQKLLQFWESIPSLKRIHASSKHAANLVEQYRHY